MFFQLLNEDKPLYFLFRFSSLINNCYIRTMKIRHFNALKDNYMYLITDDRTTECAVVDPAEPEEVKSIDLIHPSV